MAENYIDRAKENLQATSLLYDAGLYNATANRAYYSIFHIMLSLLLEKGYKPAIDHRNVISLFTNEFINRKKAFPSNMKASIYELQNARNDADYKKGINKDTAKAVQKKANNIFENIMKEIIQ